MKIRQSFVTNSSSSSFICVLGEVIDEEKFKASNLGECYFGWQFKNQVEGWEIPGFYSFGADWASVYIDSEILEDNKKYFYWEEFGGAGDDDYHFAVYDENGDYDYMNYDVSLCEFPVEQEAMYNCATSENGLLLIDRGYGAGRNG